MPDAWDSIPAPGQNNVDQKKDAWDSIPDPSNQNPVQKLASVPPDQASKIVNTNVKTGLPPDMIERNPDLMQDKPKPIDPTENPGVANLASKSPYHAAAVDGDLESFKEYEKTATLFDAITDAAKNFASKTNELFSGMNSLGADMEDTMTGGLTSQFHIFSDKPANRVLADSLKQSADFEKSMADKISVDQATDMALKGDLKGSSLFISSYISGQIPSLLAMSVPAGWQVQTMMGVKQTHDTDIQSGATEKKADIDAGINGVASAILMKVMGLKAIAGLGGAIIKKGSTSIADELGKNIAFNVLHSAGLLGIMNGAQEYLDSFGKWFSGVDENAMHDVNKRAFEKGVLGILTGGPLGLIHGISKAPEVKERVKSQQVLAQAQNSADAYERLVTAASKANAAVIAPEFHKQAVSDLLQNHSLKNTYIPIDEFNKYAEAHEIPGIQMAKDLGLSTEEFSLFSKTGTVKIPTENLLTHLASTEHALGLKDMVKFDPAQPSVSEAKASADAVEQKYKPVETPKEKSPVELVRDKVAQVLGFPVKQETTSKMPEPPKDNSMNVPKKRELSALNQKPIDLTSHDEAYEMLLDLHKGGKTDLDYMGNGSLPGHIVYEDELGNPVDLETKEKLSPDMLAVQSIVEDVNSQLSEVKSILPVDAAGLKKLGMTDEMAGEYLKDLQEVGEKAKKKLVDEYIRRKEKQSSKEWQRQREQIKQDFAKEDYDKRPEVIAKAVLEKGTMPDGSKLPPRLEGLKFIKEKPIGDQPPIYAFRNNQDLVDLAQHLGYRDSYDMMNAVARTGEREDDLNKQADFEMQPPVGDYSKQVEDAVMNEKMRYVLRRSSEYLASDHFAKFMGLARKIVNVRADEQVRVDAEQTLGQMNTEDLNSKMHLREFQKQTRLAMEALGKGDWSGVIDANEKARLNFEMHKQALEAEDKLAKAKAESTRLGKKAIREKLAMAGNGELPMIDKIRDVYSFPGKHDIEPHDMSLGEWFKYAVDTTGEPLSISRDVIARKKKADFNKLPWSEVSNAIDAITQIKTMAQNWNKVAQEGEMTLIQDFVDKVMAAHKENYPEMYDKEGNLKTDKIGAPKLADLISSQIKDYKTWMLKPEFAIEKLDGNKYNGHFSNAVFQRLVNGTVVKNDLDDNFERNVGSALKEVKYDRKGRAEQNALPWLQRHHSKSLENEIHNGWLTRDNEWIIACTMGHADGLAKLESSYGWKLPELKQFIKERFSSDELKAIQKIWDHLESEKKPYEEMLKQRVGLMPKWIPAQPIELETNDGKTVHLKGGYFPVAVDKQHLTKAGFDESKSLGDQLKGAFKARTSQGQLEQRVKHNHKIRLDWGVLSEYANDTHHDIAFRGAVIDLQKLFNNKNIRQVVRATMGNDGPKYFDHLIFDVATQNKKYASDMFQPLIKVARDNVTTVATGFKVTSMLAHGGSLLTASKELANRTKPDASGFNRFFGVMGGVSNLIKGHKYLAGTFGQIAKGLTSKDFAQQIAEGHQHIMEHPEKVDDHFKFACDSSDMMRQRLTGHTIDQDIARLEHDFDSFLGGAGAKEWVSSKLHIPQIRSAASILIRGMDNLNSMVIWRTAYEHAFSGNMEGVDKGDHKAAVRAADSVVRKTKGSNNTEDLAPVQRAKNEWMKTFTMFLNPMLTQTNSLAKSGRIYGKTKDGAQLAASLLLAGFAPAMYEALVHGQWPKEGEDGLETAFNGGTWIAKSVADYVSSGLVGAREATGIVEGLLDHHADLTRFNPVLSAGQTALEAANSFNADEASDYQMQQRVLAAEYLLGAPTEQIHKSVMSVLDQMDGTTDPGPISSVFDALVTGDAQEKKREKE